MRVYDNKNGFRWRDFHVERKEDNTLTVRNTSTDSEIKILATKEGFEIVTSGDVVIKGE